MSYPEKYDIKYKAWRLHDLPFLPEEYKYEIIANVQKQFDIIKEQMNRDDVTTIYVCTDSGREGEYIYRLVDMMVDAKSKEKKRVWIDSQTEDEIKKGVKNAKPLEAYDNLADSAFLRAKEDYLMGINFSRLLTLCYGRTLAKKLEKDHIVIAVGRVMTCVLGMIVNREREIRDFVKLPYYKIQALFEFEGSIDYDAEWKAVEGSKYHLSNQIYKEVGFTDKALAETFVNELKTSKEKPVIEDVKKKKETKNPPLLYNLAELQNELSKKLKQSPDQTLKIAQNLYEKKLITYPRTDARVLSTAVCKEILSNLKGLTQLDKVASLDEKDKTLPEYALEVINSNKHKGLEKTKYVNDKAITDHYAIIPTGQGLSTYNKLPGIEKEVYILIVRRFLAIFFPPAIYNQLSITTKLEDERFFSTSKVCTSEGFQVILNDEKKEDDSKQDKAEILKKLKKGQTVLVKELDIKESETTPPKRYNSGSIILAMENAGKLIEDDELREQIKGSGIGTSATRAEILSKLEKIDYISLNKKTQILTPTTLGESIYDVVAGSIPSLLRPELTASWEKGLSMIASGDIKNDEYMKKLESYIQKNTSRVLTLTKNTNVKNKASEIDKTPLGSCPLCKDGKIKENSKAYFCTNWKQSCNFTLWKNSLPELKEDISRDLVKELLASDKNSIKVHTSENKDIHIKFKESGNGELEITKSH
ncbi:DNA topoisomerase [Acetoanaerobium sticklandii]|uniref:DNA topoisomerase n=2 Tax=Acetoanaerobium sticklandii TaxID=1511 RepID=E3PWY5_ACESD|nr:DNA topoisomerase [Acetoanaerobium sticklandii]